MRVPILLVSALFAVSGVQAEDLSDADRETLLENLEKLRNAADSKMDARFRIAIAAYRNAIGSDDAAIDLYLNCMEKVQFEELHRKAADFREWKRKEAEKLSDPGLRLALRHQLRWLMLTLEAASVKPQERIKFTADARDIVDSIFRDIDKLKNQEEILNQSVVSTVFAQAYDITGVKMEDWPFSPIQIEQIYEEIFLPAVRKPGRLAELRATWIKRIQQESLAMETWGGRRNRDGVTAERIGMADAMQSPEFIRFQEETMPKLQWEMEVDLFRHGDQSGASVRMLAHMQKYIGHASAREWGEQFQRMLKPELAVPVGQTGVNPEATGESGTPAAPAAPGTPAPETNP
ncbi:MAG: hypothetical protein EOP88_16490 [Verrucomicrobiaceae bacterium]|nr:MAG: hypothetical protein EOP88_16490 [Verrucomicrobiaceae bacterium]